MFSGQKRISKYVLKGWGARNDLTTLVSVKQIKRKRRVLDQRDPLNEANVYLLVDILSFILFIIEFIENKSKSKKFKDHSF